MLDKDGVGCENIKLLCVVNHFINKYYTQKRKSEYTFGLSILLNFIKSTLNFAHDFTNQTIPRRL